ncbi:Nuclear pore complex protein NUP58 [Hibiscus syriacus]|uniref:Nuclear pore complex protein NUP58 n=1 Tax=Hibiscus syriacus TaxID=106335 RepID=A0A6A3AJL3_HIBSY|nr:nuclear pore complex protein NUP58-like [Hibiscus syriacus]KAE8703787.1 Nuclear pore complex protein NUP58 [Hibiscus syriacus]
MSSLFATPLPQQPQSFQPQQQQSPFQQSSSPFFQHQQQQLQQQPQLQFHQHQQQQQQQQPQQQPLFLFTNDKTPATYSTKWADLHPDSQKFLLQIEERILEYRDESQRLDQCSRLYNSSVSNEGFELDASHIVQELGGIVIAMERQKDLLQELMATAKDMLRNIEIAVRSFMMHRPRFLHSNTGGASNATAPSQAPGATMAPGSSAQPTAATMVPVFDFYHGLPKKPSPLLQYTIARFEKYLCECRQWIEELEQLLLLNSERNSINQASSLLQSLPKVMSNVHDFFVQVAAKVESIHQYIQSMKTTYLADHRGRGDVNDPFLEADRRETAKQEAAAKRLHLILHLPTNSQPSTQVAGLLAGSATTPAAASAPQTSSTPASSMSSSLFATPTTGASIQTSLFSSSSRSLFASASTPSLFSSTIASAGGSFSIPFASGAPTGSGPSFGAASKSSRPKSRTTRR